MTAATALADSLPRASADGTGTGGAATTTATIATTAAHLATTVAISAAAGPISAPVPSASGSAPCAPVVILGAGVHGVAIARELLAQGVPVVLVDRFDLASGATAKSSRLIHGGLRYLEFGDLGLVRESLAERAQMLQLAAPFVRPLRLFIPVRHEWSGLMRSAVGFLGLRRSSVGQWLEGPKVPRGFWPLRMGLSLYDWLSRRDGLPGSAVVPLETPDAPRVDRQRYRQLLAYSDAQMLFPERFVLALLADADDLSRESGVPFTVQTYATVRWQGDALIIEPALESPPRPLPSGEPAPRQPAAPPQPSLVVTPAAVVNATGAWGDQTLQGLGDDGPPRFGGTRGSHFITWNQELRAALKGQAIYAEADDGRLVFVLPFGDGVLVGTTDETERGPIEGAVATADELRYLRDAVTTVFGITLADEDVTVCYSGVRPLPRADSASNAAVTRDHRLEWTILRNRPVLTLIGGKLTTWRAFAEEVADQVLERLGHRRRRSLVDRLYPGAVTGDSADHETAQPGNRPQSPDSELGTLSDQQRADWAARFHTTEAEVAALWPLFGTRLQQVLASGRAFAAALPVTEVAANEAGRRWLPDSPWSAATVQWIIAHEQVRRLDDLVERRLMSVFQPQLTRRFLAALADELVSAGRLSPGDRDAAVRACVERLATHYGRRIDGTMSAGDR